MGVCEAAWGVGLFFFFVPLPCRPLRQAFDDRTFVFDVLPPPTSWYLKRVSGVAKGSAAPGKESVGKVKLRAIYEIAKSQQKHDPGRDVLPLESVVRSICASARSMGLKLEK